MSWSDLGPAGIAFVGVALGSLMSRLNTAADRKARAATAAAAAERNSEQEAIIDLLVAVRLLAHRANGFRMTVKLLQSRTAKRERRRGDMVPLDVDAAFERLVSADQALARASGRVWLNGEPDAVRLTNKLTLTATDVVDAHLDGPREGLREMGRKLQMQYTTKLPGDEEKINAANAAMGAAGKALAEYARKKYGMQYVDLFEPHADAGTVSD